MLRVLSAGESTVVRLDGESPGRVISVIAGAGATVTLSRVDSHDASAHDSITEEIAAGTIETFPADWPYYLVSVAGGSCRVAVI